MKTTINITLIGLVGLLLGSCSTGLQRAQSTGSSADGIYYMPNQPKNELKAASDKQVSSKPSSGKDINLAELEKKYTNILANNEKVDTVVYRADSLSENPYERVLSTSYRESYERRLRGRSGYRAGNWGYYSNDYFYASAYDPYFYNTIVMGDEVWVEPYYITAMFGWPRPSFYFGFGWGYYYSPWYMNSWYYNPWGFAYYPYSYWGYNSWWNGYSLGYYNGYWNGYYWGNNTATNPTGYYSYGPRPGSGSAVNTSIPTRPSAANLNDRIRDYSNNQPVLGTNDRQRSPNAGNPDVAATRPNLAGSSRENIQNQDIVLTRPNRANVSEGTRIPQSREPIPVTRPVREGGGNQTAISPRPNEAVRGSNEPARENYMPTYTRPKPASSSEYNRPTRTYTPSESERGNADKRPAVAPSGGGQPVRTYSPPAREERPASTPGRGNEDVNRSRPSGSYYAPSNPPASRPTPPPSGGSSGSSGGNDTKTRNR